VSRPGRFLLPGKTRYPLYRRLGGPQNRSGQVRKTSHSTGIRSLDLPARSQSLYRLSYLAHVYIYIDVPQYPRIIIIINNNSYLLTAIGLSPGGIDSFTYIQFIKLILNLLRDYLEFAFRHRETKKNLCRGGR
jgi:hypothetical protein